MEMENRISRLLSHIARTNLLPDTSSKRAGDLLILGKKSYRIVLVSLSSEKEKGYFIVDSDFNDLSEICVELSKMNPKIVAPEDVEDRFKKLIELMKNNGWSKRGIKPQIANFIKEIKGSNGEKAKVIVPIWGLNLGNIPLLVGDVEFKPKPFSKDIEENISLHINPEGKSISTIAITSAVGERAKIFENAKLKINKAINIIRAFTFPVVGFNPSQEISYEGDFSRLGSIGLIFYDSSVNKTESVSAIYGVSMHSTIPLDIKKNESHMKSLGFNELIKIVSSTDKFTKKILKAVDWLGEATKPDVLPAKFVKVAFSIDAMIGEASSDIPDKGKRARISERAAFIIGHRYRVRKIIYDKMNMIIKKRDDIAHGDTNIEITESEVEEAARYATTLLRDVLLREPKFKTSKQLAEWVQKQSLLG